MRAHEQSTTAKPHDSIKDLSWGETEFVPFGLQICKYYVDNAINMP